MPEDQNCPNCGEDLDAGQMACPHCGARYGRNRGALFIAIALFLVGAGLWREGWLTPIILWAASAVFIRNWLQPVWMIRDSEM